MVRSPLSVIVVPLKLTAAHEDVDWRASIKRSRSTAAAAVVAGDALLVLIEATHTHRLRPHEQYGRGAVHRERVRRDEDVPASP